MTDAVRPQRRWLAPFATGAVLFLIYAATVAPTVTFWDAGELIAAAHSLGIPHPPGTPLFILLLSTWGRLFGFLPFALATNLFSAAATAMAGALTCALVAHAFRERLDWSERDATFAGIASAIAAGSMSTAWSNATETELYGASLCLAIATLWCAAQATVATDGSRWRLLVAYLFGLAAPLHVSALIAAPAAIYLANADREGRVTTSSALELSAAAAAAMAVGTLNPMLGGVAAGIVVAALIMTRSPRVLGQLAVTILAASALLFMLIRARHDPAINQGDPSTVSRWIDVIARTQYDLPGLWPRRAPLWIQLGNWFEFADWQVALSLGPTVVPTVARTLLSIVFAGIALYGGSRLRGANVKAWRAATILTVCGSLGVALYLNLRATPSFAWGILAENVEREARERDYFFVLGFWGWGVLAGIGAVALARRYVGRAWLGLLLAAVPLAANWAAVRRTSHPDASAASMLARSVLSGAPPSAVLIVAGDNDTYPLWHAQTVERLRPDVTVVTAPLIMARWYAAEMGRRHSLIGDTTLTRRGDLLRHLVARADSIGRPAAVPLTIDAAFRNYLGGCWTVIGSVAVRSMARESGSNCVTTETTVLWGEAREHTRVDTAATATVARGIAEWSRGQRPREAVDPVIESFFGVLECPSRIIAAARRQASSLSLDSLCNSR